ncbi:MAG: choice-of-anchor L domain-containing protein [Nannocystales bacterium]
MDHRILTAFCTVLALPGCDSTRQDDDPFDSASSLTATGGIDAEDPSETSDDEATATDGGQTDSSGGGQPTDDIKWDVGFEPGNDSGGTEDSCKSGPMEDLDGDGFTVLDGDCNDCDANVNPGAIEVIDLEPDEMGMVPSPADEDCDGGVDNIPPACDGAYVLNDADPLSGAGAMGLCKVAADDTDWGIINAQYVRANGTPVAGASAQTGLSFDFGPNVAPQEGSQMLVLSTGNARTPGQPDACGSQTCFGFGPGTPPPGFPQDVPQCPGESDINDDVALEVTLRTPTNATGFSYNFNFYSFEYPEWVCDSYNDQYIAHVTPAPEGAINGNISFDSMTNPVSVNIAFFEVCAGCPLGTAELAGTGFDVWNDAGATSWLVTTAPVTGGQELTIRFAIWDTGDAAFDSTVLLDNFRWIADGGSVSVGTTPEG